MGSVRGRWWAALAVLAAMSGACIDLRAPRVQLASPDAPADVPVDRPDEKDSREGVEVGRETGPLETAPMPPDDEVPLPPSDGGADGGLDAGTDGGPDAHPPDAAPPLSGCARLLQDGFESGSLDAWEVTYDPNQNQDPKPNILVGSGAIAGSASLATTLGQRNAARRTFTAASKLRLAFTVDLAMMTTESSIPMLLAMRSGSATFNLVEVYFGRGSNGPVISVRAYENDQSFERISFASLPASRVDLRIEWEAQTASRSGVARLFVDGAARWTSPALSTLGATVTELRLGNTGSSGTGTVLYDEVVLESCP